MNSYVQTCMNVYREFMERNISLVYSNIFCEFSDDFKATLAIETFHKKCWILSRDFGFSGDPWVLLIAFHETSQLQKIFGNQMTQ